MLSGLGQETYETNISWCVGAESHIDRVSHMRNNAGRHGCWLQIAAVLTAWHTQHMCMSIMALAGHRPQCFTTVSEDREVQAWRAAGRARSKECSSLPCRSSYS